MNQSNVIEQNSTLTKGDMCELCNVGYRTFSNWMRKKNKEGVPLHKSLLGLSYSEYKRINVFTPKQTKLLKGEFL